MVSVLLPYRDAEDTIVEALSSVLAEDVVTEVVAIDDGSRDQGFSRVNSMHDARIVHVRTEGVGVAGALREGLRHARGELIARMDADDVSRPGRIASSVKALARDASVAVAACQVDLIGEVTEGMRAYVGWQNAIVTREDHARSMFVESPVCHPATTIRRSALEAVGGFRDAPWAEDWDLWLRLDAAGFGFVKIPEPMLEWRQHGHNVTRRDPRCSIDRLREARATYLAPRLAAMQRPIAMWGAGPTGKRLARELERHGVRTSRFIDIDPRKIGHVRRGVPVIDRRDIDHVFRREHAIVVAVGARGARDLVRAELLERGFVEGTDFIAAA